MAIYSDIYYFDGIPCSSFNLTLCSFDSQSGAVTTNGAKINFTTVKPSGSNKWYAYNRQYESPFEFTLQVIKKDSKEITIIEQEGINRWMMRNDDYHWLQFEQDGYRDMYFNVQVIESNLISVGNVNVGMEFKCITDSPFGYSAENLVTYNVVDGAVKNFMNQSEETGKLEPQITVTINSDCNFSIYNDIEDRTFTIKNCVAGEILTIDNENKVITSSISSHDVYEDFNLKWFRFFNTYKERINNLTFSGNATVTFKFRYPRKVGV
jgi:ribosomal protein S1